jgi:undecaprenyl pyrophosphate phosphatase UppP
MQAVTSLSVARIPIAIVGAHFVTEFSKQVGFTLLTPLCIVIGNSLIQTIPSYTEHNLQLNDCSLDNYNWRDIFVYISRQNMLCTEHSLQIPAL